VGNGELEESLKGAVESFDYAQDDTNNEKDSSIKNRIHFMDFQNQSYMPVVYQACDLFCLPSHGPNETWGLAVNEAMAAGKAILVSDKVGCGKDLINESNGYIFKSSDVTSLRQCLTKILSFDLNAMGQFSIYTVSKWNFKNQVSVFVKTLYED